MTLERLGVATAGIEFDPDGKSDYVCFRDPDNIQLEFILLKPDADAVLGG